MPSWKKKRVIQMQTHLPIGWVYSSRDHSDEYLLACRDFSIIRENTIKENIMHLGVWGLIHVEPSPSCPPAGRLLSSFQVPWCNRSMNPYHGGGKKDRSSEGALCVKKAYLFCQFLSRSNSHFPQRHRGQLSRRVWNGMEDCHGEVSSVAQCQFLIQNSRRRKEEHARSCRNDVSLDGPASHHGLRGPRGLECRQGTPRRVLRARG